MYSQKQNDSMFCPFGRASVPQNLSQSEGVTLTRASFFIPAPCSSRHTDRDADSHFSNYVVQFSNNQFVYRV